MTEARHFHCTACGQCCYGLLPLTLKDALAHAARFPLAFLWTPAPPTSRHVALTAKLGTLLTLPNKTKLAVLIAPVAYLPASFPCPALRTDMLCAIHTDKPLRCKTMPFYPYRDERAQTEFLVPRPGWLCSTSQTSPLVYQNNQLVDRVDFDAERKELLDQAPVLRRYADYMVKHSPALLGTLMQVTNHPRAEHLVTSLSSFLTATRAPDTHAIARLQLPVLEHYAALTLKDPMLALFHQRYHDSAIEMAYLSNASGV